jgi:hypothetical protein
VKRWPRSRSSIRRLGARIEAAEPFPPTDIEGNAWSHDNRANTEIAKIDVLAMGSIGITAAGEGGLPAISAKGRFVVLSDETATVA